MLTQKQIFPQYPIPIQPFNQHIQRASPFVFPQHLHASGAFPFHAKSVYDSVSSTSDRAASNLFVGRMRDNDVSATLNSGLPTGDFPQGYQAHNYPNPRLTTPGPKRLKVNTRIPTVWNHDSCSTLTGSSNIYQSTFGNVCAESVAVKNNLARNHKHFEE